MDTIFALASAPGKAGIAVIRISGRLAFEAAGHLCGQVPDSRAMRLAIFKEANGDILDTGMMLSFQKPASFTGEDVIELHLHGSVAVVSSVLRELGSIDGLRLAQPGEFTRRALENGKLDLAQVEGLADLIDSETEAQRRLAQKVFSGALGDVVEVWRRKLIRAAALIEATIDFADEDVPVDVGPEVAELLEHVAGDLRKMVMGVTLSERIRQGFEVAIMGPPNVGKSTLLNMLAGRDAAITSEIAGTTRDVIEVRMDLGGLPVTLLDTAGLRETDDKVESIGIARAKERAERADLRVFLCDVSGDPVMTPMNDDLVLLSKGDLFGARPNTVSGLTGQGVDHLIEKITSILSARAGEAGLATRERHRQAFQAAIRSIEEAQRILSEGPDLYDITSDEIRHAIASMEVVVGRVDVENLLDEIFASFCLGK